MHSSMNDNTRLPADEVQQICRDCGTKRGWEPVPFPVGVWPGKCDDCHETKPCTAPRDYRRSPSNPLGR